MLQFSANIVTGGELLPRIWALVPLTVQRWGFGANGDNNGFEDDDEMLAGGINYSSDDEMVGDTNSSSEDEMVGDTNSSGGIHCNALGRLDLGLSQGMLRYVWSWPL